MATIVDVAEQAGVSIKTVSRVINNQSPVANKTREKVLAVMQNLQYQPSAAAQQLRSGKSHLVGILYTDPSSGYQARFNHAMLGVESNFSSYVVSALFSSDPADWLDQLGDFLENSKVTKLVLVPPLSDSAEIQFYLRQHGLDFVLVSPAKVLPNMRHVAMDDRRAAREMTNHLINLGHTRIGHLTGHPGHLATMMRRQGFEEALLRAGLPVPGDDLVRAGNFDFQKALTEAEILLTQDLRPTAIFAANDEMAAAVYMVAGRLGLEIPKDLSVAGFDNTRIAETIWPSLTTVAQPFDQMAKAAILGVDATDEEWSRDAVVHANLPFELKIRESCAAL